MEDDSILKIMQALDLDYSKAVKSTMEFEKSIGGLNKQLANMKANAMKSVKDINNAFSSQLGTIAGNKGLVDQFGRPFKNIRNETETTAQNIRNINKAIKESTIEQMKAQAATVQQRATTKKLSGDYANQAGVLRKQLNQLHARLKVEGKLSAQEMKQTHQLKEQLKILKAQTSTATADKLRQNPNFLGEEFQRRTSWFLTGTVFYGMINAAQEATKTIKDVEMGMVELARVMDDSTFVFDEYRDKLFALGVEYGQTFENVQQIALRWAQSGYNVADSLELTRTSLLALNTAELDAQNATEAMIGIMAQWKLEAEDMSLVMDKVNKTADNFTITSQDLVDGLLRSSGAARIMNLSLDETIGILTVMREASGRTGREVGNALNSILSYIQRPKAIGVLEGLGIDVFADKAKTQFRNVLDIFRDISANWNTVSKDIQDGFVQSADDANLFNEELAIALGMQEEWNDLQQRDIAQASAGVYRRNYFIGMIERMANVQDVLNNMMDAGGYSMEENAKTMETLEKQTQSLMASMEQLAVAIGDAGFADVLVGLVENTTDLTTAFNELPEPMKDTITAFTTTFVAVKTLQVGMKTFGLELPKISLSIKNLKGSVNSLSGAFKAGVGGVKAFIKANAALLVLSTAVGIIVALRNASKKHTEEKEKAIEVTNENIKSLDEERKGLIELSKEYDTLKSKQENLTATADEKERLKEVQQELVDLYDVSITGIDEEGNAYADSNVAIRDRIKAIEELTEAEKERLETMVIASDKDDVEALDENLRKREKTIAEIEKIEQRLKDASAARDTLGTITYNAYNSLSGVPTRTTIDASTDEGMEELETYISNLSDQKRALLELSGNVNDSIKEGTTQRAKVLKEDAIQIVKQLSENGKVISDETRTFAVEFSKGLSQTPKGILALRDELEKAIDKFAGSDFDKLTKAYQKAMADGNNEAIDEASADIMNLVEQFTDGKPELDSFVLSMERLYPTTKQMANALENSANETFNFENAMAAMNESTKQSLDNMKDLNQALYDVRNGQSLSADTMLKLIDLADKYKDVSLDSIKKVADGYTVESDVLKKLKEKQIKTNINSMNEDIKAAETVKTQAARRITAYKMEIRQIGLLAEARATLADVTDNTVSKFFESQGRLSPMSPFSLSNLRGDKENKVLKPSKPDFSKYDEAVKELEELRERSELLKEMLKDDTYGIRNNLNNTEKYENKQLDEALKLLEHRKKISEETQDTIRTEISELQKISSLYVKTDEEKMDMAERLYSAEKRLMDKRLQDSVNWINEKKNLDQLSAEEEIKAWERVKNNQSDNIEAIKQATLNLYKLRNQMREEYTSDEEATIKHLANIGVYGIQEQIDKYKELYSIKADSLEEERKRVENLFGLYKSLLEEEQDQIKKAYEERVRQIDEEAKKKKKDQEEVIEGIEKELRLIDKREQKHEHERKMADLREQLAYWEVRTSEEARKKVAELLKEIDEEEHDREVELEKQGLEEKKRVAEDEVRAIDEAAKEQKERWERSYKQIEEAFDEHSVNIVALTATMSKKAYEEWEKNYLTPLQKALEKSNYDRFDSISDDLGSSIDDLEDDVVNSKNSQIYRLASSILDLKKQYMYAGDKNAHERAIPLYEQLSRLSPSAANILQRSNIEKAQNFVKNLPKAHTGGKTLSYGAVYMKPGELIFPPDLATKLDGLINALYARPVQNQQAQSYTTDRRVIIQGPLYNSEKTIFEDDVDGEILARQLQERLYNI